ncbi:hypothetical protein Glove_425g6 [Diversispora epigaea]|uniref:Uncharacterized protein n=1 Tax=Diversispora epigaea TaxID=1348612 RepID=A0A397H2N0_9GLOM|nr:hypothetical protein Glove_425g6 [Diversispora epigaea]
MVSMHAPETVAEIVEKIQNFEDGRDTEEGRKPEPWRWDEELEPEPKKNKGGKNNSKNKNNEETDKTRTHGPLGQNSQEPSKEDFIPKNGKTDGPTEPIMSYYSRFKAHIREGPELDDEDKMRYFKKGLKKGLHQ